MAAGDITRDTGSPVAIGGGLMLLTGSIEVDDTKRAFALCHTTSHVKTLTLVCEDGTGTPEVQVNKNASGTATNGTVAVLGNDPTVRTYRFNCIFAGF